MKKANALSRKFAAILPLLDERARRLVAASEARSLGYGGVSEICRASGLSRKAIAKGIRELAEGVHLPPGRVRRAGAGRKKVTVRDPELLDAIAYLIEPETREIRSRLCAGRARARGLWRSSCPKQAMPSAM